MKKYIKLSLILCLLLAIGLQFYFTNATDKKTETAVITDSSQLNKFQPIINEYFKAYFEAMKTGNSENLVSHLQDNQFKEYMNLLVTSRYNYFKKLNQSLHDYEYTAHLNYAKVYDGKYVINVKLDSSMIYENSKDSKSAAKGDDYLFILEKVKDEWTIDYIIYDENETADINKIDDKNYINDKLKAIKQDIKDMQYRINEINKIQNNIKSSTNSKVNFNQHTTVVAPDTGGSISYNRNSAVSYARWWYNSFNPNYPTFSNDCTNFTSQCVYAGSSVFGNAWYCYDYGAGHTPYRWDYTYSWIRVVDFHDWIVNNNSVGPWGYDTSSPEIGDVIQFFKTSDNAYTHGAVITQITNGIPCYTGHSQPRLDYSVSEILKPGSGYSSVRYIHVF